MVTLFTAGVVKASALEAFGLEDVRQVGADQVQFYKSLLQAPDLCEPKM